MANKKKFFAEVGKIKEIKDFEGGVDSHRKHINEMVKALNTITQLARQTLDPKELQRERVVITVNGDETPALIPIEFTT